MRPKENRAVLECIRQKGADRRIHVERNRLGGSFFLAKMSVGGRRKTEKRNALRKAGHDEGSLRCGPFIMVRLAAHVSNG